MPSDFRIQYITGTYTDGVFTRSLSPGTHFLAINDSSRALIIPANGYSTVGYGTVDDTAPVRTWTLSARMIFTNHADPVSSIELARGVIGEGDCLYAFYIIEYIGPAGGDNDFHSAYMSVATMAASATTASTDITSRVSVAEIARCVPFVNGFMTGNGTVGNRYFIPTARIFNSSGSTVTLEVARGNGVNGVPSYVFSAVNFVGNNWSVQSGVRTGVIAAETNIDIAVSAVNPANTIVYTQFNNAGTDSPAAFTHYAWLSSSTNLRIRVPVAGLSTGVLRWYLITNPQISVERIGTPDGVADWAAASATQSITTSPTVAAAQTLLMGHAGSSSTTANDNPSHVWSFRRISATQIEAFRARELGSSEFVAQVIQLNSDSNPGTTINPQTATWGLGGRLVFDANDIFPGCAQLSLQTLSPLSTQVISPVVGAVAMQGLQGSVSGLRQPGTGALSIAGTIAPMQTVGTVTPATPVLDYTPIQSTAPTFLFGGGVAPGVALLVVQSLPNSVTEGGDIKIVIPDAALMSLLGLDSPLQIELNTSVNMTIDGLVPTLFFEAEEILTPDPAALGFTGLEPVSEIPFQWIDVDHVAASAWDTVEIDV